jgi:hypothetical protein
MPISDIFECLPESLRTQVEAYVKTDEELSVIFDMHPDIAVAILVRRGMSGAPRKAVQVYDINQAQLEELNRLRTMSPGVVAAASPELSKLLTPAEEAPLPVEEEPLPPWRDTNPGINQDAQLFSRRADVASFRSPHTPELLAAWDCVKAFHPSWSLLRLSGDVNTPDGGTKRVYGWAFWSNLLSVGTALNRDVKSGKATLPLGWSVENLTDLGRGYAVVSRLSES